MSSIAPNLPHPAHLCGIAIPSVQFQNKSKELLFSEATYTRNQKDLEHAAFAAQSSLWENGQVLDYSFFGGTPNQHSKVEDTIQEWTWYANITFTRSTPNNRDATLRIAFDPTKGSWSYVGNAARDCDRSAPTMNLGWISDNDTLMRHERGVILHQFGHVLGLMHEHEHPARSGIRRLREAEVLQYYKQTQGLDEITIRRQVLDVYSETFVSSHSQYDPTSIMTYFMPASMNLGGVDILEVTELSMFDKAFAVANYPRKKPHPRAHQWTPYFALTATGASVSAVVAYIQELNIAEKRKIYTREMVELRLHEAKRLQLHEERKVPHAPGGRPDVVKPRPSDAEKVQDAILSLLFTIAPKASFSLDLSAEDARINPSSLTLEHSIVQSGLLKFFTKLISNAVVKKVFFNAANITPEVKPTHIEKIQNKILSLLLGIAPKTLLVFTETTDVSGDIQATLDLDTITLDHPAIQRGLLNFFTKLASHTFVGKAVFGAVKVTSEMKQTHVEKIQNKILSILFNIAPQSLLIPTNATPDILGTLDPNNLSLENPIIQRGLVGFFSKLVSNTFVKTAVVDVVKATADIKELRDQTYEEKVQEGILSLLFGIAPKHLLVPTIKDIDVKNITLDHPVVQRGLLEFFTRLASHKFVKTAVFGAVNVTTETKLTHVERVQNAILSLLFGIAPKSLLTLDIMGTGTSGTLQQTLDLHDITLEHPTVQHGLETFFSKLASNVVMRKAILSAEDIAVKLKFSGNVESSVHQTYEEKVQNKVLSLLFDIAPKGLLVPDLGKTSLDLEKLTLEHPIIQRGLGSFFEKLASHKFVTTAIFNAVNVTTIQKQTHAEKVQNKILSLLFNVAPKSLLVSTLTTTGSLDKLDIDNLTLDNSIVQHALTVFFSKLASDAFVKKSILNTDGITAELKLPGQVGNGVRYQTHEEKVQQGILSLLFKLAPQSLLAPDTTSDLDPDNLTLDHPAIQRGLMNFFTKLASYKSVRTAIFGAVNVSLNLNLSGDIETGIRNQTYTQKVQEGILSLLFDIAPKHLLAPRATPADTTGSLDAVLDVNSITLDHPVVQRALGDFFARLVSDKSVKKAILKSEEFKVELKLSGDIRDTRKKTYAEEVQDEILYLLFKHAPKSLLIPTEIENGVSGTRLDLHSLTLEHSVVQRGLQNFFSKLVSSQVVRTTIFSAINSMPESTIPENTMSIIRNQTYAEKVQNKILSLLFTIAPGSLLVPDSSSTGVLDLNSLTLDHPVVQNCLTGFFVKLTSNQIIKKTLLGAVNITTESNTSVLQTQTHIEKIQDGILALLFKIAPKNLLTPNAAINASGTLQAALDQKNLTLENSIVQRGLLDFFKGLASNISVKKAMLEAVDVTLELKPPKVMENGFGLNADLISSHQVAHLVSLILADRGFKDGVNALTAGKAQKADDSLCEYTVTIARKAEHV